MIRRKQIFMLVALLALEAASGVRILLFLLLVLAIFLIVIGAFIATTTMYFYWNARLSKAEGASRTKASLK